MFPAEKDVRNEGLNVGANNYLCLNIQTHGADVETSGELPCINHKKHISRTADCIIIIITITVILIVKKS